MRAALQDAIIAKLQNDAAFMASIGGRLFDVPPGQLSGGGPEFPYASIGEPSDTDWDTKTDLGIEATTQINIWSQAGGKREALDIVDKIWAALHEQPLSLDGHVLSRVELTEVFVEDPQTFHGVVQLRTLVEGI